jgi:hypothetical protein
MQQRCVGQGMLESIKWSLSDVIPDERGVFMQQSHESFSYLNVVTNETVKEVCFSLQNLELGQTSRWG